MNKWEFLKAFINQEIFRCDLVVDSPVISQDCKARHELRVEVLRLMKLKMKEAEERDKNLVEAGLREAEED